MNVNDLDLLVLSGEPETATVHIVAVEINGGGELVLVYRVGESSEIKRSSMTMDLLERQRVGEFLIEVIKRPIIEGRFFQETS